MKISILASGLALGAALALSPAHAYAQSTAGATSADEPDAVTLKHGGMIKGKVTEILPGDHATVLMSTGQNAIIRWDEIGSISKGGTLIRMEAAPPPQPVTTTPPPTATPTTKPVQGAFYGPKSMPYEDDEPIPPGYHVETHKKLGLLITGAILTGIGLAGILAYDFQDHVTGDDRVAFDIVWGALFLGPGVPLLLVGIIANPKKLVRDDQGKLELPKELTRPSPFFIGVDPHKDHPGIKFGLTF